MNVVLVWNGPADGAERDPLVRRQVPLLVRLRAQGVSTTVVLLGDGGGLRGDLDEAGVDVALLPTPLPPGGSALARLPAAVLGLRALLRRRNPDVVEGDEPLPAIAVGLCGRARRHVVLYRRHHAGGRRRLILASRMAARLADRTLVSCQAMRLRAAAQDRMRLERIDVASSGTADVEVPAPDLLAESRASLGIGPGAQVVLALSRLRWEKGLDVLIRALDRIADFGDLHAVVIGVGPEDASLRRMAARSRVPVHFLGHRPDVGRWLAVADVVAMPSRRESFGRVTLETMAAGRPLVASRVDGLAEAVADGETGLLVPPEDAPALAAALRVVLGDPARARGMGRAARQRYQARYTIDHMATSWREAWERAVTGASPRL